jgi:hypothetical protein
MIVRMFSVSGNAIDLMLIEQQSVGKRSLHLTDTVNAKKRWTTIYWRINNFWQKATKWHALLKNEHHFWNLTAWMIIFRNVWLSSLLFYSFSGNAKSMGNANSMLPTLQSYWNPFVTSVRITQVCVTSLW